MRIKNKVFHKRFAVFPIKCRKCKDKIWLENYIVVNSVFYNNLEYCKECASKSFSDYPYKDDYEVQTMKQCETCINKDYKEKLMCCCVNELGYAMTELFRHMPVIGKHISEHECTWYERDGVT